MEDEDAVCLKIHGIILEEQNCEDFSDSDCEQEFDEKYALYKPPPIPIHINNNGEDDHGNSKKNITITSSDKPSKHNHRGWHVPSHAITIAADDFLAQNSNSLIYDNRSFPPLKFEPVSMSRISKFSHKPRENNATPVELRSISQYFAQYCGTCYDFDEFVAFKEKYLNGDCTSFRESKNGKKRRLQNMREFIEKYNANVDSLQKDRTDEIYENDGIYDNDADYCEDNHNYTQINNSDECGSRKPEATSEKPNNFELSYREPIRTSRSWDDESEKMDQSFDTPSSNDQHFPKRQSENGEAKAAFCPKEPWEIQHPQDNNDWETDLDEWNRSRSSNLHPILNRIALIISLRLITPLVIRIVIFLILHDIDMFILICLLEYFSIILVTKSEF